MDPKTHDEHRRLLDEVSATAVLYEVELLVRGRKAKVAADRSGRHQPRESRRATVAEAMRIMLDRDVGALLVVDTDGKLVGIFSERDLLTKVAGIHSDYAERPIVDFMTP